MRQGVVGEGVQAVESRMCARWSGWGVRAGGVRSWAVVWQVSCQQLPEFTIDGSRSYLEYTSWFGSAIAKYPRLGNFSGSVLPFELGAFSPSLSLPPSTELDGLSAALTTARFSRGGWVLQQGACKREWPPLPAGSPTCRCLSCIVYYYCEQIMCTVDQPARTARYKTRLLQARR